jgi:hypothetical protein
MKITVDKSLNITLEGVTADTADYVGLRLDNYYDGNGLEFYEVKSVTETKHVIETCWADGTEPEEEDLKDNAKRWALSYMTDHKLDSLVEAMKNIF